MSSGAPALRRLVVNAAIGVIVAMAVTPFVALPLAVLVGWDAAGVDLLASRSCRSSFGQTELGPNGSPREKTRPATTASLLVQASCAASLVSVAVALGFVKHESGGRRALMVTIAIVTVILSWTVVNCVFTLRYADLFYRSPGQSNRAVDFGYEADAGPPDYRDFAYLAFTIGMTYQVSDTALHDRRLRGTVLYHAFLSYFFGVVIVATGVNVIAGLVG